MPLCYLIDLQSVWAHQLSSYTQKHQAYSSEHLDLKSNGSHHTTLAVNQSGGRQISANTAIFIIGSCLCLPEPSTSEMYHGDIEKESQATSPPALQGAGSSGPKSNQWQQKVTWSNRFPFVDYTSFEVLKCNIATSTVDIVGALIAADLNLAVFSWSSVSGNTRDTAARTKKWIVFIVHQQFFSMKPWMKLSWTIQLNA